MLGSEGFETAESFSKRSAISLKVVSNPGKLLCRHASMKAAESSTFIPALLRSVAIEAMLSLFNSETLCEITKRYFRECERIQ